MTAGLNTRGQLGLGDTTTRGDDREEHYDYDLYEYITDPIEMGDFLPAVSLGTGLNATAISCGWKHACALLSNAQIKCWGGSRIIMSLF